MGNKTKERRARAAKLEPTVLVVRDRSQWVGPSQARANHLYIRDVGRLSVARRGNRWEPVMPTTRRREWRGAARGGGELVLRAGVWSRNGLDQTRWYDVPILPRVIRIQRSGLPPFVTLSAAYPPDAEVGGTVAYFSHGVLFQVGAGRWSEVPVSMKRIVVDDVTFVADQDCIKSWVEKDTSVSPPESPPVSNAPATPSPVEPTTPAPKPYPSATTHRCSFCGKAENEVAYLVAGPCVWICNECVSLCSDIVTEHGMAVAKEALRKALSEFDPQLARVIASVRAARHVDGSNVDLLSLQSMLDTVKSSVARILAATPPPSPPQDETIKPLTSFYIHPRGTGLRGNYPSPDAVYGAPPTQVRR